MNIRLLIEYDGFDFCGWQRQAHCPSIQAWIEDTLSRILEKNTVIYGAGRTDSGVHAQGQVANFHTDSSLPADRWAAVLNYSLPRSIRVLQSEATPEKFHAQKDAVSKRYAYRVLNRPVSSALERRAYFHPSALDWDTIREALPYFLGEQDFKAFQGAKATVRGTVRRIDRFELFEEGSGFYKFRIEGNGFLKQMVRAIVGTLIEVGEGKRNPRDIGRILRSGGRQQAGRTAPPHGLYLERVGYRGVPPFSQEA